MFAEDMTSAVVRALTLYSLREAQEGHASVIQIDANGASFRVSDNGRGHAVDRTVNGEPYLKFVYEHLSFPFGGTPAPEVQLHVIGMSLIAAMCTELRVEARKTDAVLRLEFRAGKLHQTARSEAAEGTSGNTIAGTLAAHLAPRGADVDALRGWLREVAGAFPALSLVLNGEAV